MAKIKKSNKLKRVFIIIAMVIAGILAVTATFAFYFGLGGTRQAVYAYD